MNLPDTELIVVLEQRDGPLPERSWAHASADQCRYAEMYDGRTCPWCEAAERRREREASRGPV